MKAIRRIVLTGAAAASMMLGTGAIPAAAAPPPSDIEAGATVVDQVPFTHSEDTTEATAGGPRFCSNYRSVFYTFTPVEDVRIQVDTLGSDYDTTLAIYTRDEAGQVHEVSCNDDRLGYASGLRLRAAAGTSYLFMVGRCCGNTSNGRQGRPGGQLAITVTEVSSVPLEFTLTVDGGTVDPATGIATISGTVTCTKRSVVYGEGELRQLRDGLFVAKAYWYASRTCTPEAPVSWSLDVDTYTGVAFGPGTARLQLGYANAWAGWREYVTHENETITITLV